MSKITITVDTESVEELEDALHLIKTLIPFVGIRKPSKPQ